MRVGIDNVLLNTSQEKKTSTTKTYREKGTNEKVREKELSGKLVFPEQQLH